MDRGKHCILPLLYWRLEGRRVLGVDGANLRGRSRIHSVVRENRNSSSRDSIVSEPRAMLNKWMPEKWTSAEIEYAGRSIKLELDAQMAARQEATTEQRPTPVAPVPEPAPVSARPIVKPPVIDADLGGAPEPPPRPVAPREPPAADDVPVLNLKALDDIRSLQSVGGPDILAKIIHTYLTETPKLLTSLRNAALDTDVPTAKIAAHTLKSSSANLGAMVLSKHCRELEAVVEGLAGSVVSTMANSSW